MIKKTLTCSADLVCIAIKHKGRESAAETHTLCFLLSGIASIFLVTSFLLLNKILLLQGGVTLKCPAFSILRSSMQHVPRHCLLLSHAGPVTHKLISSEIPCLRTLVSLLTGSHPLNSSLGYLEEGREAEKLGVALGFKFQPMHVILCKSLNLGPLGKSLSLLGKPTVRIMSSDLWSLCTLNLNLLQLITEKGSLHRQGL